MNDDDDQLEDWQPGDGMSCAYAARAATPCPFPTKTRVMKMTYATRSPAVKRTPLCINHANRGEATVTSTKARKVAIERLVQAHFEEYQDYLKEALS